MDQNSKQEKVERVIESILKSKQRRGIKRIISQAGGENLLNEELNSFLFKFRKLYLSGKVMKFKDWLIEVEDLIDELK